jgi:hypothetical protein
MIEVGEQCHRDIRDIRDAGLPGIAARGARQPGQWPLKKGHVLIPNYATPARAPAHNARVVGASREHHAARAAEYSGICKAAPNFRAQTAVCARLREHRS